MPDSRLLPVPGGSRSAKRRRRRGPTRPPTRRLPAPRAWYQRRGNLMFGAVVVVAAAAVIAAIVATGGARSRSTAPTTVTTAPGPTGPAQQWVTSVGQDLSPISSSLISLVQTTQSWPAGKASASVVQSQITVELPLFAETLRNLSGQVALPSAPTAKAVVIDAIDLYVAAFQIERTATRLPATTLRQGLQQSFERTRELGDRVYDLGTTVALGGPPASPPSTPTVRPADVPDWAALGLAAGPPLDAVPPLAATSPPNYQVSRPQQSASGWLAAVSRCSVPSPSAERLAIVSGAAGTLRQLADETQAAVVGLDATSDPAHDRLASTATRLSLLVTEEAFRTAEASRLVSAPAQVTSTLDNVAQVLADIADQLWAAQLLGPRQVGFSPGLLDPTTITNT